MWTECEPVEMGVYRRVYPCTHDCSQIRMTRSKQRYAHVQLFDTCQNEYTCKSVRETLYVYFCIGMCDKKSLAVSAQVIGLQRAWIHRQRSLLQCTEVHYINKKEKMHE